MSTPSHHWLDVGNTLTGVSPFKAAAALAALCPFLALMVHGLMGMFWGAVMLPWNLSDEWMVVYAIGVALFANSVMAWCLKIIFKKE